MFKSQVYCFFLDTRQCSIIYTAQKGFSPVPNLALTGERVLVEEPLMFKICVFAPCGQQIIATELKYVMEQHATGSL